MPQIVHISDSHIGPTADYEMRGANPLLRLEQLIDEIEKLDFVPDAIVHTGDVTDFPSEDGYRLAAKALSRLKPPLYFVTGNHDDARLIHEHLTMGPHRRLCDGDMSRLAYEIEFPGLKWIVLDAKVEDDDDPSGFIPLDQLDAVRRILDEPFDGRIAIAVHYPALALNSPWIDDYLLLQNGEELHRLLTAQAASRIAGVFFGHLHRGLQIYRDGILYSAVSSCACQFSAPTSEKKIEYLPRCPTVFNHLSFSNGVTVVKEYSIGEP